MSAPAPRPSRRRPPKARSGLLQAVLALGAPQQRTAAAALVVLVSLGTPWYSTEVVFPGQRGQAPSVSSGTMTGIAAFSFVEAAVLLVAGAVLVLVWARATGRSFSLPISDGTVVTVAAGWLGVLIVYRLFDRPEGGTDGGSATLIGLSWGIFATLAAVGLLLATGLDQRRRDEEQRARTAAPPEGPVVDPADLVPVTGDEPGTGGWDVPPDAPTTVSAGGAAVEATDRTAGTVEAATGAGTVGPAAPGDAPPPTARTSRSWSFDDPDSPEPPPARSEPSRRRPSPPQDPTRPLGRTDAADQLRGARLREERPRPSTPDGGPPDADAEAPTRVAGRGEAFDPTRALPPSGEYDPAPGGAAARPDGEDPAADATDVTRVHEVPPARRDEGRRARRRRRRDGA